MKRLIFILSYNAERHIEKVLKDIPDIYANDNETEILLIDDASKDKTFEVATEAANELGIKNIKIMKNPINQGYGGNQKIGYQYAIEKNFDQVAMLHGDWQYTPEVLPELFEKFDQDNKVDCVLGVRFGRKYSPLRGGMPFYKFIGNKVLTKIQNFLAGRKLHEWHTGYRLYRVRGLKKIPFQLNTNDFHFDTEILLQLINQNCHISEVNIPTHYRDEVCHVNGMSYAINVLKASLKFKLQKYHLFYDIRFYPHRFMKMEDTEAPPKIYTSKVNYMSVHSFICGDKNLIKPGSRVLDVGCSTGYIAKNLSENKKCQVVGVDMISPDKLEHTGFEYHQVNLEKEEGKLIRILENGDFDYVLMLDVLEHLNEPELFLLNITKRNFKSKPVFIFSTGNVAFLFVRFMLLMGQFNYGEKGILDITHKRLFSIRTFKNTLEQTGFILKKTIGIPFPFRALDFLFGARFLEKINMWLIKVWTSLFSYQGIFITVPLNHPHFLLKDNIKTYQQHRSRKAAKK